MELLPIEAFEPRGAIAELFEDLDSAMKEIASNQPLPDHLNKKLTEDLLYDRVYSSAVTEGNRLSRRETIAVLTQGLIEAGSRKDIKEIEGLGRAILQLDEWIRTEVDLTVAAIRELHKVLMEGLDKRPGQFRNEDVAIAGSKTRPPSHGDVPDLMKQIGSQLAGSLAESHPLVAASWAHWAITRVHPFRDGNGRIARLAQDYVLLRRR